MNESHRICINAPRRSLPKRAARYAKRALAVGTNKLGPDGCNEWTTKDHRRYLLFAASGGLSIKKLLEIAIRTLDEANLRILIKRLARGTNRQTKAVPDTDIDLIICYFWDDGQSRVWWRRSEATAACRRLHCRVEFLDR